MPTHHQFVLTLACRDTKGIVHAVSGLLYQAGCNIIDSQQFGDLEGEHATGFFFMRVHFQAPPQLASAGTLNTLFEHTRQQFGMDVHFHALGRRPRLLLMVSQHGHCLNDLLFRWKSGSLAVDIPAIVSNHRSFEGLAASYGIPFHHLPLTGGTDGKVSAGGAAVSGKVGREGLVRVSINGAYANGQLSGKTGSGKWNGSSAGVPCSGRWEASRQ